MPLNLNPERVNERGLVDNLRSIERHLIDDHYKISVPPGTMILQAPAVPAVVSNRWGVVEFPAAADSSGLYTYDRPSEWVLGKVRVTIWYSAPAASTNNFRILLQVTAVKTGGVTTASALLLTGAIAMPGPAVLNTVIKAVAYSTVNVTRDMELLTVRVMRQGTNVADTNAGVFHLYHTLVEHVSAVQEAT